MTPIRWLVAALVAAIVSLGVHAYLVSDPTVHWTEFEKRLDQVTKGPGMDLRTLEIHSPGRGSYTIPWWIQDHPRRWSRQSRLTLGFPNATQLTVFEKHGQRVTCLVFYLDGYASMIALEYPPGSAGLAQTLSARLRSEFVGMRLVMNEKAAK